MTAETSVAGLEPNNLAVGSGQANAAASIAAESIADDGLGHSRGAASTAAAGNSGRIAGVLAQRTFKSQLGTERLKRASAARWRKYLLYSE